MSRSLLRAILITLAVLILVLGGGGAFVWWKISGLKEQLLADLGKALGAQVQVASLDVDLFKGEIRAAGITLTNQRSSAPWEKGDISQATLRFHLSDILSPSLPVSIDVSSWNVVLHSPLRTAETPPAGDASESSAPGSGGKGRVRVTELTAGEGTVEVDFSDDRKVIIHDVNFVATDNGTGIWTTQLKANSIVAGTLKAGPCAVDIRSEFHKLDFSELHMQVDQGLVTGEGEVGLDDPHTIRLDLKSTAVPVTMLVAVDWQMKLFGLVDGNVHYEGDDKSGNAKGQITVNHGKFNVLPWLGKLSVLIGIADISAVEVDKATSDFTWKDGALELTNLDVRKLDVTRIAGTVDVDKNGVVDGKIKLGLPSTVISKWPQLQDKVFPTASEDFNWADVHLTGTSDHLQEDLTPRVLAAADGQGSDLLNSAAKKAEDLYQSVMGK